MRAWFAWIVVTFGVLAFAATSHDESKRVSESFQDGTWQWSATNLGRAVRVYLTDELDEQRYEAYVHAALGRAYQPYFIRRLAGWDAERTDYDTVTDTDAPAVVPPMPLVPYRDFVVEYPPGFFLWAIPPALFTDDMDTYRLLFTLWMALIATFGMWLAARLAQRPSFATSPARLVAWGAAAALALGVVVTHRYDAAIGALLCMTAWGALNRRPGLAGAALGLAIASKGLPILAAPGLALWYARERQWRALGTATLISVITVLAVVGPALWVAGGSIIEAVGYHANRPLQIESTAAALVGLVARPSLQVIHSHGSINIVGPAADWARGLTGVFTVLGLLAAYSLSWWQLRACTSQVGRERLLLAAMLVPLAACMVTAKVFSPQYLVWLLPLATLLAVSGARASAWIWLGICAASQVIYPAGYHALGHLAPWACALVALRNLTLAGWGTALVARAPAAGAHR